MTVAESGEGAGIGVGGGAVQATPASPRPSSSFAKLGMSFQPLPRLIVIDGERPLADPASALAWVRLRHGDFDTANDLGPAARPERCSSPEGRGRIVGNGEQVTDLRPSYRMACRHQECSDEGPLDALIKTPVPLLDAERLPGFSGPPSACSCWRVVRAAHERAPFRTGFAPVADMLLKSRDRPEPPSPDLGPGQEPVRHRPIGGRFGELLRKSALAGFTPTSRRAISSSADTVPDSPEVG